MDMIPILSVSYPVCVRDVKICDFFTMGYLSNPYSVRSLYPKVSVCYIWITLFCPQNSALLVIFLYFYHIWPI